MSATADNQRLARTKYHNIQSRNELSSFVLAYPTQLTARSKDILLRI